VSVQVATIELNLPATITVGGDGAINLFDYTFVNDELKTPAELDAAGLEVLFFASEPGDGNLPPGVVLTIDQETGLLTVTSGSGQSIEVTARLFGTAGELANTEGDGDIIAIE
jgi:hypothetical protein